MLRLLPIGFMLAPFAMVGAIVWVIVESQNRRKRTLQHAAHQLAQMGFQVEIDPPDVPRYPFREFSIHNLDVGLRITRIGTAQTAFQMSYVVGSGDSKQTIRRSCAVVPIPFVAPDLAIWRGGASIVGRFDPKRVETDSEAFNSIHEVRCPDERFAYTALSYEVIEWLMKPPPMMYGTTVRMSGPWMMLILPEVPPIHLPELLDLASSLRAQLPTVLTSLYPYPGTTPPR